MDGYSITKLPDNREELFAKSGFVVRKMELVLAYDRLYEVRQLFKEYTDMIISQNDEVREVLESQHFEDELADLDRKYGFPSGRLYIAVDNDSVTGCAGLTRNDDLYCELKRLYIRPEYRGQHISRLFMDQIIADAKDIGYKHMRLDTFPFMKTAVNLYKRYGFYYIEKYNDNPAHDAVFMQLDL